MNDYLRHIGIFGGTFDPVHTGHLIIASAVFDARGLDRMLFIPSARPPHKRSELMFDAETRYVLLQKAVKGDSRFMVSDCELKRDGLSYSIDTIHEIKNEYPGAEITFLLGMDNLFEFEMWKNPEAILDECTVTVARRITDESKKIPSWLKDRVVFVDVPLIEISSTGIRALLRENRDIRYYVPDAVREHIVSTTV